MILVALKNVGGFDSYNLQDVISLNRPNVTHLGVINGFKTSGPGLLIELGSISSPTNRKFLKDNSYSIGKAIATSVFRYFYDKDPIISF
ncbi:MAG: hypothetical protein WDO19_21960 [Bacteroidota bacterium]